MHQNNATSSHWDLLSIAQGKDALPDWSTLPAWGMPKHRLIAAKLAAVSANDAPCNSFLMVAIGLPWAVRIVEPLVVLAMLMAFCWMPFLAKNPSRVTISANVCLVSIIQSFNN